MEKRLKRFLSLLLAIVMVIGMMPANIVFAEGDAGVPEGQEQVEPTTEPTTEPEETTEPETEPEETTEPTTEPEETEETKPVCTRLADCAAENHEDSCEKKIADDKAAADKAAADAVAALIAALPTLEQLQAMPFEEQTPYYNQVQSAYGAYCALTADQQALLPPAEEVFKPYFDYFNSLTAEVATSGICGDNLTWTLNANGTLTISGTGAMTNYNDYARVPWNGNSEEITSVVITGGVTSIGDYSFFRCGNLANVTIPDSVTRIGSAAFCGCSSLTNVTIPNSVTAIEDNAFSGCSSLTSITIPDSVTSIEYAVFMECSSLTSITIPDSVTDIASYAFQGCSSLTSITIPSVHGICDYAFYGCSSLTSITIPDGVGSIGKWVFYECNNLTSVTIPDSVTSIGDYAFGKCKLSDVYYAGTQAQWNVITINDCNDDLKSANIHYGVTNPAGHWTETTVEATCKENGYRKEVCACAVPYERTETLTATGNHVYNKEVAEEKYLETSATCIAAAVYHKSCQCGEKGTETFTYGELGDHVRNTNHRCTVCGHIGGYCGDPDINDGKNVTWSFDYSTSTLTISGTGAMSEFSTKDSPWYDSYRAVIESVVIQNGVTTIGSSAFYLCTVLESAEIPSSITSIDNSAFSYCYALTDVTISKGVTNIGEHAFRYCESLTSIEIPSSVTSIGRYAFTDCHKLTSIELTAGVTSIGESAFSFCNSLKDVYFRGTQTQWNAISIGDYNEYLKNATIHFIDPCADGHDMGDWVVTEAATCTTKGSERRDCDNCDHYETRETDKLDHVYEAVVTAPTCTEKGYTTHTCACSDSYVDSYENELGHTGGTATCKDKAVCTRCEEPYGEVNADNHADGTEIKNAAAATCTEGGYTGDTYCLGCGQKIADGETITAPGHKMGEWVATEVAGEERSDCSRCDHYETRTVQQERVLKLESEELKNQNTVWINGLPYSVKSDGEDRYVEFESEEDCMMATYTYHVGDAGDVHTQYPTGMKVYRISNGKITYIPELDNLLQYSGSSIRITGKKGIRMITSLYRNTKAALTGGGLAGYKLVEYGTMLCWSSEIASGDALVLGKSFTRSNYAYKRGVADPVFATTDKLTQYTNVLVGFTNEECKDDIAMRPYIILEDANGQQFTLYGGTIHRSIAYIAYQNRKAFSVGSGAYNYVWDIIHYVYGNKYDADYKG